MLVEDRELAMPEAPQAIIYCDKCGRIVPPSEVKRGQALLAGGTSLCGTCLASLPAQERERLAGRPRTSGSGLRPAAGRKPGAAGAKAGASSSGSGVRRVVPGSTVTRRASSSGRLRAARRSSRIMAAQGGRAPTPSRSGMRPASASHIPGAHAPARAGSWAPVIFVGLVIGALVGGGLGARYAKSRKRADERQARRGGQAARPAVAAPITAPVAPVSPAREEPRPPAPATGLSAARRRLNEIKRGIDSDLSRYDRIVAQLEAFEKEYESDEAAVRDASDLLADLREQWTEKQDDRLSGVIEAARSLASQGKFGDAIGRLESYRREMEETDWFKRNARARLAEEKRSLGRMQERASSEALPKAKRAFAASDYPEARALLAGKDSWLPTPRAAAVDLLKRIEAAEEAKAQAEKQAAEEARAQADKTEVWKGFLARFVPAGREGFGTAKDLFDKERPRLRKLGLFTEVDRLTRMFRKAGVVEELAEDNLLSRRNRIVSFNWKGKAVSGRVTKVEKHVLSLRSPGRKTEEIPIAEIAPGDLIKLAGLSKKEKDDAELAALYLASRAMPERARGFLADVPEDKATLARSLIQEFSPYAPEEEEDVAVAARDERDKTAAEERPSVRKKEEPPPEVQIAGKKGDWPKEPLPGETGMPGDWAPGLIAEIFRGENFDECVAVRIDRNIGFDWRDASPDPAVGPDMFSIRWTGALLLPHKGKYTIRAEADDSMRVTLGGEVLEKGQIARQLFDAGLLPLVVEYKERADNARARLRWQPTGGRMEDIPSRYFFHEAPKPGELGPPSKIMPGLIAEFFEGEDCEKMISAGIDRGGLRYNFRDSPPCSLGPSDNFVIRYRGYLFAPGAGQYKFRIRVNDGVRLQINGGIVVNHWESRANRHHEGSVHMDAGLNKMVLDHLDKSGDTSLEIRWQRPDWKGNNYQFVGANLLYCDARRQTIVPGRSLAPALKGTFFLGDKTPVRKLADSFLPTAWTNWSVGQPAPDVPKNHFSAIWKGALIVPRPGKYLFRVKHWDGFILNVGGRKVMGSWSATGGGESNLKGDLQLPAGKVPIQIQCFNKVGRAGFELSWCGPDFRWRAMGGGDLANYSSARFSKKLEEPKVAEIPRPRGPGAPVPGRVTPSTTRTPAIPAGNLVTNGGFEVESEKLAQGWTGRSWGSGGKPYQIKLDRAESHSGDCAVLLRALEEGALPGVTTTVKLERAKYVLKFWACADIEETAQVHVRVGERELTAVTAEEDWKEFTHKIEIEEREPRASLRIWTDTAGVKVWLDDVSLEAGEE